MFSVLILIFGGVSIASGQSHFGSRTSSNQFLSEQALQQEPLLRKQFFIHSAPEDNTPKSPTRFVLGKTQVNHRVVFVNVKSDSATAYREHKTRFSASFAPVEEKLVLYLLRPKEHEIDANDIATPAPTTPSKPEVFFVKYKTPEEALHAQQQIQAQYDALGGTSEFSDEGDAPISSVEGSLQRQF